MMTKGHSEWTNYITAELNRQGVKASGATVEGLARALQEYAGATGEGALKIAKAIVGGMAEAAREARAEGGE